MGCAQIFLQQEGNEDVLDFWLDVQQHENLCRAYFKVSLAIDLLITALPYRELSLTPISFVGSSQSQRPHSRRLARVSRLRSSEWQHL